IYLYIVPAKVGGRWEARMPPAISKQPASLTLKQQLTRVSGSLRVDGRDLPLEEVKLRGDHLSFRLAGHKGGFSGVVKDGATEGDALALPYGRTPISTDERPKLAARCNVLGQLVGEARALAGIKSGQKIRVERADAAKAR